jgi:hypothetical protein
MREDIGMVSKSHPKKLVHDTMYLSTVRRDKINYSIDRLVASLNLRSADVATIVQKSCELFMEQFIHASEGIHQTHQIIEFVDACKNRYSDLEKLDSVILNADARNSGLTIYRARSDGSVGPYKAQYENRISVATDDDDEIFTMHRNPKCYKSLFLGYYDLVHLTQREDIDQDTIIPEIVKGSRAILSIAKVYEDIRGTDDFVLQEEKTSLQRLNKTHTLDHTNVWYNHFLTVIQDINEGLTNMRPKAYINDIVTSLRKVDRSRNYNFQDYHVSFKSTGTRFKGKSIPGLYASLIEIDPLQGEADPIGYTSNYNKVTQEGINSVPFKTITIEQHKVARRTIHMANNAIQDRYNYFHNIAQEVLDNLIVDCTRNQDKGVTFASAVTHPSYRMKWENSVYSLDISKATDTLDQEIQEMAVSIIFGDERAKFWSSMMKYERQFCFSNGTKHKYYQLCGQAQGFKSSFPLFAWVHHLVMRSVMVANNLTSMNPKDFYRVLGDDSIMSCKDPKQTVRDSYISCCNFINWDVNKDKGFTYIHGKDTIASAEFAKMRIVDGVNKTPIPIRLIINSSNDQRSFIQLLSWVSAKMEGQTLADFRYWLEYFYPSDNWDEKFLLITKLRQMELIPILNNFKPTEIVDISSQEQLILVAATLIVKFKQTLVDIFLPDYLRGEGDLKKREPFLNTNYESELMDYAEDMNNKYFQVIQNNIDRINAIDRVFGGSVDPNAICALELTAKEQDLLITCCDFISNPFDLLEINIDNKIQTIQDCIKLLARFNPRSDVKAARNESGLLESTILIYNKIVNENPQLLTEVCEDLIVL